MIFLMGKNYKKKKKKNQVQLKINNIYLASIESGC
jgi:hypothetical protein